MMSDERLSDTTRYDAGHIRGESTRTHAPADRRQQTQNDRMLRRKARRRKRFAAWATFVLIASLALSGVGWLLANDFAAFNKEPLTATITVTKDDNLRTIANKLKAAGLIEYRWFFKLFGRVAHAEGKIGIGEHELNTQMDYNALINGMRSSSGSLTSETVRIVVPEGYTLRQIVALLAKYGVSTEEALLEAAANYDFGHAFITGEKGNAIRLEGYLFPDTYEFYVNGNPATALGKMLNNFSQKMDNELMEQVDKSAYSLSEIITIASLIEKETDGNDRSNIASVINNRLNHVGETHHLLQIDAAQIYGLGERYTGKLSQAELQIDTPYNTHLHEGLPPTPIANPGLASIRAALEPAQTGYYFYALGTDGTHHFFDTYAKFLDFVNSSQYMR